MRNVPSEIYLTPSMRTCLLPLTVVFLLITGGRNLQAADAATPVAKPKFIIGKDTTYITKPLRPDGYPDYFAATVEIFRRGVTPDNNAAVPLMQAFGPKEIRPQSRPKFFHELGLDPLPETGNHFQTYDGLVQRWTLATPEVLRDRESDRLNDQFNAAQQHPWTVDDYPIVAEWLKSNEIPLQLIVEASRRTKRYFPLLVDNDQALSGVPLPYDQLLHFATRALVARAMQRTAEGNADEAWQDLLACHRLARLTAREPFLVEVLFGYAWERAAIAGDAALLHAVKLSPDAMVRMHADINTLPPLLDIAESLDTGERFLYLDTVARYARGHSPAAIVRHLPQTIDDGRIDWNAPLRSGNQWFDRMVTIARMPESKTRRDAEHRLDDDLKRLADKVNKPGWMTSAFSKTGDSPANINSNLCDALTVELIRSIDTYAKAQRKTRLLSQLEPVAFALAAYRVEYGKYPASLDAIVPKYLAKIPLDTFAPNDDTPVHYRREGEAYVLWSVGRNGVDDNGHGESDDPPGDDVILRPLPPEKKPGEAPR